jgi:predicted metal-dependent HD superfamily phosphohydrolase
LAEHWQRLGLGRDLYVELVTRWSEPHRHYHDVRHLAATLGALDTIDDAAATLPAVQLAAWFHDAVYEGVAGVDEQQSADLAQRMLGELPASDVAEVVRLVLLTARHDPQPGDAAGAALCDADLAILGALPGRYDVYVRDVRLDYAHVDDATWSAGRTAVLDSLLALDPLFRTSTGRELWQDRAVANLVRERARWTGGAARSS